jgi:hypothetical protein
MNEHLLPSFLTDKRRNRVESGLICAPRQQRREGEGDVGAPCWSALGAWETTPRWSALGRRAGLHWGTTPGSSGRRAGGTVDDGSCLSASAMGVGRRRWPPQGAWSSNRRDAEKNTGREAGARTGGTRGGTRGGTQGAWSSNQRDAGGWSSNQRRVLEVWNPNAMWNEEWRIGGGVTFSVY